MRVFIIAVALALPVCAHAYQSLDGQERAQADTAPLVHEGIINAPVAEVWRIFTTGEGFKSLGVAQADVDLRIGGLIRSHYSPDGVLGDPGTIQNQIIAFEPERMLAIRIHQPPAGFPFKEAWKGTWSVITFHDLGDGRTALRIAGLGYTADPESQSMRTFFQTGNEWTVKTLQSRFDREVKPGAAAGAHAEQPLAPISAEVLINAARQDVWQAFTTSEGWKAFIGVDSSIGTILGDPFEIYFGGQDLPEGQRGSEGCLILATVPNELFSFSWNAPPHLTHARKERTWVIVRFESPSPTTTKVRLQHLGFSEQAARHPDHAAEWTKTREYFAAVWPRVLDYLAKHFAREQ